MFCKKIKELEQLLLINTGSGHSYPSWTLFNSTKCCKVVHNKCFMFYQKLRKSLAHSYSIKNFEKMPFLNLALKKRNQNFAFSQFSIKTQCWNPPVCQLYFILSYTAK